MKKIAFYALPLMGIGGSLSLNAAGHPTVSASKFSLDTTFLSDPAGTGRGHIDQSDGGAANTEGLRSFAVAHNGNFTEPGGFRYHRGFSSVAEGNEGTTNQSTKSLG
ncbi:MAG: hypothetical protein JKY04_06935 [Sneathiella sp.]|nr:hypothetical protein [Sneathiella sp.]